MTTQNKGFVVNEHGTITESAKVCCPCCSQTVEFDFHNKQKIVVIDSLVYAQLMHSCKKYGEEIEIYISIM